MPQKASNEVNTINRLLDSSCKWYKSCHLAALQMSQYSAATTVKRRTPLLQLQMEAWVQRCSRIESNGNSIFTWMLLQCFERHREIANKYVSQSAIAACMRSVCVRNHNAFSETVEYKPCSEVQSMHKESAKELFFKLKFQSLNKITN